MALNAMVLVAGDGSTVIVPYRVYQRRHPLSAACTLCSLCACVCVCVDQDRAGAVVREVEQKQIQLDKDRTLLTKTELKTQQRESARIKARDTRTCVCRV